ncbi:MAG: hypothetical protein Fur0032_14430 [Terrimicrobiaceae bacterium]
MRTCAQVVRGWTLTETLVAIGIILLLVVLLVPAMGAAKEQAASARCVGNLRALGGALQLWLADNRMTMPPLVAARASQDEEVPVIDNTLNAYVEDPRVFSCPADRSVARETGTSYFWNSVISGQAVANLDFLSLTSDMSRIPVMLDKEGWHAGGKVNHLFADGHAGNRLELSTSP